MNKKYIERLVNLSYTRGKLDDINVQKISKKLSKNLLREYIKVLKKHEQKNNLLIMTPQSDTLQLTKIKKHYERIFPKKNILFKEDRTLIGGLRIIDDDNIYEFSIKEIFNELINKQTL